MQEDVQNVLVQLGKYELCASGHNKHTDQENILQYLLGYMLSDNEDLTRYLLEKKDPDGSHPDVNFTLDETADALIQCLTNLDAFILKLGEIEASGYPLLASVTVFFAQQLQMQRKEWKVKVSLQFVVIENKKRGQNPACDAALIRETAEIKPIVLYEYKPSLSDQIIGKDAVEMLIQAFYCLQQYKLETCTSCLTDLTTWWYFKIRSSQLPSSKLEIVWSFELKQAKKVPTKDELKRHWEFIYCVASDLLSSSQDTDSALASEPDVEDITSSLEQCRIRSQ